MSATATKKRWGLLLSLEGAPNTPHSVPGLPGYFRADVPRLVGDGTDIPHQTAKELSGDDGAPLKMVQVEDNDVQAAEETRVADIAAGRGAVVEARRGDLPVASVAQLADEIKTVADARVDEPAAGQIKADADQIKREVR